MWLPLRSAPLLFLLLLVALCPRPAWAAPPCVAAPALTKDIQAGAVGAAISEPVDVNGTLFFVADDGVTGEELWKSDGTAAGTVLVKDLRAGATGSEPKELTAVGTRLFFLVPGATQGVELWTSDGTANGTVPLEAFAQMDVGSDAQLTAVGSTLYFVAEQVSGDAELWKVSGTPLEVKLVRDIYPGPMGSFPSQLTAVGNQLFFRATEPNGGYEPWKSDGTAGGTVRVKDLVPGAANSTPAGLTAVGQLLYFFASSETGSTLLWRSDGTEVGTVLVREFGDSTGVTPQFPTAAGNTLFFQLDGADYGAELWRSDGTRLGTVLVKDIQPGTNSSSPRLLTAVGSTLFFVASDGVHGDELWKSDGSAAGTRLVRDIVPGSGNPDIQLLAAGPGVLLMTLADLVSGAEPWRSDGTLEGTYLMADLVAGAGESAPREFRFSGTKLFFAATQAASGQELFVVPLGQVDCNSPRLDCPARLEIEALSRQDLVLNHPPLGAEDDALFGLAVYFTAAPVTLRLGIPMTVSIIASDLAGNVTACSPELALVDKTSPLLLCPDTVEQEATGPAGVKATFFAVASDAVSRGSQLSVVYQPERGTDFPVGTRTVTVTAADEAANRSVCTFPVTVRDTTPPRLRCPADTFHVATNEEALAVDYTVEARDAVTNPPELTYNYPPRGRFPLGETTVNVQARDGVGNTSQCSFKVMTVDPQAPTITCPETQVARSSGEQGAVVNFPEATAKDNLGSPEVRYSHAPGSTFPEGETEVTATASDLGGQSATCTFKVQVERGSLMQSGASCQAGPWGGSLGWLLLVLIPAWARRWAGRVGR